ncbi:MAG TPA: ferric reductase-like transmembrane domain-containing protein, partial [Anaerolineales bacterium]|nr:ferric reductase-like transmembrane domain-containing protein [Anaerolineales bacterium]
MSTHNQPQTENWLDIFTVVGVLVTSVFLLAIGLLALQTQTVKDFFALDSVHIWWYVTRAAGLMGYLLFWLSTVWGFAISSKIFDSFLERMFTFDFHEHLSLLSLGFLILHVAVLLIEKVEPLSLTEVLVPFVSTYRPFWTGIGIITFYLTVLVTITFYIRKWISMKTFRVIHYLSVAAYFGALLHSVYAGTDTSLTWVQWMYGGTTLVTVFFMVYWAALLWMR